MAEKNNKICIICNKEYHYCPSCHQDKNKPSWYAIFDGENCKSIYDVCTEYRDGVIDKKVAYERITKLDITDIEDFTESTKAQIKDILAYKRDVVKAEAVKIDNVKKDEKSYQKK